ncbi:MAG: hypothetical protein OEU49_00180 [Chromatiales bacterium]|jgi:hypothetical protein|nr:hypothetical protein [Chromatiales bacterium]
MTTKSISKARADWDRYEVCRRLVRSHPISISNPAVSTGCMDPCNAKAFWTSVAEYPDPLQDVLFVIAHAQGFEASLAALDRAIREDFVARHRPATIIRHPAVSRIEARAPAPDPRITRAAS